jgi:shikimate kinase
MMGSGKTTIGRLIAARTGWPRFDNDQTLRQLYGMTARQLVETRGEEQMRAAEDAALAHNLNKPAPAVIDAAAGTILSAQSRAALRDQIVVWLRASPETLFHRAAGGQHRPWLAGGEDWIREATEIRDPLYASVADVVIDTDGRTPDEVAAEIIDRITKLCPGVQLPDA